MEGETGRGSGAQVAAWLQEFSIDQTIGAGLNEDIERIIYLAYDEFEKQEGPRFKLFIEVWQKTCLGQIFSGRESFREMFEFSEELFVRVKRFALSKHHGKPNHQLVRCAALYMLYSLYFKQPCRPRAKIRLVASELSELASLVEGAKREAHWDVLYAWCKLLTDHAFHYTACESQMGLEVAQQMEVREAAEKGITGGRDEYFRSKEYLGLIKKLGRAHAKYTGMKNSLASSKTPSDQSLYLADPVFPTTLRKLVRSKQEKKKEDDNGAIGRKRRELKDRAFGGAEEMRTRRIEQARELVYADEGMEDEDWKLPRIGGRRGRGRGAGTGRGRGRGSPARRGRKRNIGQSGGPGPGEGEAGKSPKRRKKKKEKTDQQGNVGNTQAKGGGERKTSLFPRRVPKSRRKEKEKTDFL